MTFTDYKVFTCPYDNQTFDDAGVYSQHMMMYHGISVVVPGTTIAPIDYVQAPPPVNVYEPWNVNPDIIQPSYPGPVTVETPIDPFVRFSLPGPKIVSPSPVVKTVVSQANGSGSDLTGVAGIALLLAAGIMLKKPRSRRKLTR